MLIVGESNIHTEHHAGVIHTVGHGSYRMGHPFGNIRPSLICSKVQIREIRPAGFFGLVLVEVGMINFTDNDEQCGEVFMLLHVPDALPDCSVTVTVVFVCCVKLQLDCHTKIPAVRELDINM